MRPMSSALPENMAAYASSRAAPSFFICFISCCPSCHTSTACAHAPTSAETFASFGVMTISLHSFSPSERRASPASFAAALNSVSSLLSRVIFCIPFLVSSMAGPRIFS